MDVQYALNLRPERQSLCRRTIERSIALFREDDLAQEIMHDVTAERVTLLEMVETRITAVAARWGSI